MRTGYLFLFSVFTAIFVSISCDSKSIPEGLEGGDCYWTNTCDGYLICIEGVCEVPYDVCPENDRFCHEVDYKLWSDKMSSAFINWFDATAFCGKYGGRLPTISELRTLIRNCPVTETNGSCSVTDTCLSDNKTCLNESCDGCKDNDNTIYSALGDTDLLWSSSEEAGHPQLAWHVDFSTGGIYSSNKLSSSNGSFFRCIR